MQSIGTGIADYLSMVDPNKARELKVAQYNSRFAACVQRTWGENPYAADYVLAHVNGLFFAKDTTPRKGADKNADRYFLGVYLDDPTARAELDARREPLSLALRQDGFRFDEIRIIPAKLGMRERRLFPDARKRLEQALSGGVTHQILEDKAPAATGPNTELQIEDEARLLQVFKRAVCLAVQDIDQAHSLLARVNAASLEEASANVQKRRVWARYRCRLYTQTPDSLEKVVEAYAPTIISQARRLGLYLASIDVMPCPTALAHEQAFPAAGQPRPMRALRGGSEGKASG